MSQIPLGKATIESPGGEDPMDRVTQAYGATECRLGSLRILFSHAPEMSCLSVIDRTRHLDPHEKIAVLAKHVTHIDEVEAQRSADELAAPKPVSYI